MKTTFIISGLFLVATLSFAQSLDVKVLSERTIGKIMATQEKIKAREYIFPERIYHAHIDTVSKLMTIQLLGLSPNGKSMKNRGKMLIYDAIEEKVKWSKRLSYRKNSIHRFGSTVIYTKTGADSKSRGLDIETGKKLWQANNIIHFVDPAAQIGIGYTGSDKYDNTLEGIDLKTGKSLWQRELNREYGWNDVFQLNDSVWMIIAAGLHTVNVHNGSGWTHHAVTGKKDYRVASAINMAGVTLGLLTGIFVFAMGHDLVRNIDSNVYSDSTGFYFASKEKISRIRKGDGTDFWYHLLPAKLPSTSSIFAKADTLFMINYGYAFMGNRQINFGTPFFAAFNKENGEQVFFHTFDNNRKNPILDFKIENNHVWLIFKDKVMKCSLLDGFMIFETLINSNNFGELRLFADNRIYVDAGNSSLTSLLLSNTSQNHIFSNKRKVLIFDAELNIVGDIDEDQLYFVYQATDDYKLATKDNQTVVLDADNNKVAEIDITRRTFLVGNKLYGIREKSLFEIDVTNLIEQLQW
jgi:outer membrane protein assembly factor BamB